MDEAFFLRAKRLLDQSAPAKIDHHAFLAEINARQAETPTARASGEALRHQGEPGLTSPVATLILGDAEWARAVRIQGGCFSRAVARRAVNRP